MRKEEGELGGKSSSFDQAAKGQKAQTPGWMNVYKTAHSQ